MMEKLRQVTPTKLPQKESNVSITTPSGGLIFNPFHMDHLSGVGQITFSPGIFAIPPVSPIDKSNKVCPNGDANDDENIERSRSNLSFVLSPDTQADLFPADIDEDPFLQRELQERLDTECIDSVQDTIHSFFKSHLIAPSPDTMHESVWNRGNVFLPRTSSIIPPVTPKGRRKSACSVDSLSNRLAEAAIQTALTVPPDYDLDGVLSKLLADSNYPVSLIDDTTSSTTPQMPTNQDSNLSSVEVDKCTPSEETPTIRPSLTACTVFRHPIDDNLYACASCCKQHTLYRRRSLFFDSSEITDKNAVYNPNDDDEILTSGQPTLVAADAQSSRVTFDSIHMTSRDPDQFDQTSGSLVREAAALQLAMSATWPDSLDQIHPPDSNDLKVNTEQKDLEPVHPMSSPSVYTEEVGGNFSSSPSPPLADEAVRRGGGLRRARISGTTPSSAARPRGPIRRRCTDSLRSPCYFPLESAPFASPDISPILPCRNAARVQEVNDKSITPIEAPVNRLYDIPSPLAVCTPPNLSVMDEGASA